MPHLSPSSGSPGPHTPNNGPFEPFQNEFRKLNRVLGLFFDDPEQTLRALLDEILALPPQKRYTESATLLVNRIVGEVGSTETADALLPNGLVNDQRLGRLMEQIFDEILDDTLKHVWQIRDAEEIVVLTAGHGAAHVAFRYLNENPDCSKETKIQLLSCVLGYVARLTAIEAEGDEAADIDQITTEVLYALYYLSDAIDDENLFPFPENVEMGEIRSAVLEYGAALAYSRLNISIGRAAELAEQPRLKFEDALRKFGVVPRYGPDSVDELEDGIGIIDG